MGIVDLKYLECVRTRKRLADGTYRYYEHWYFRRNGRRHKLPPPNTPGFHERYQSLLRDTVCEGPLPGTVAAVVAEYRASPELAKAAPSTRANRDRYLDLLAHDYGRQSMVRLDTPTVYKLRDRYAKTPGKADNLVATLSALCGFAIKRGVMRRNPCQGVERLADGEYEPWPAPVMERALADAGPMLRLAIQSHFYTGQRIGDVVRLRRPAPHDHTVQLVQQKTGKHLIIPLHRDFRAAIDRVPPAPSGSPAAGLLLYNRANKPFTKDALRDRLRTLMNRLDTDYKFHGLRKNAVIALLQASCSVAETASITGQTYELVEYYAKRIDQLRMATSAISKWERADGHDTD
ncbi:phage integrase family protein [Rhodothalassium salexigens DSM 2132]|uniref:Phage integrase family protein n=1 Tax=Rhodothalassium salexigens DSM 2132 TaxID=1188247 RepID=A0A4V2SP16_RHOSA|nr:tyrosine-type recombinase/integrase [Rhodothalassium salexigens]MBB4212020.1 integrase [Rhodothalassium salexigens DSM 2132]MBK1638494.1 hypothetical protein [Rhodothalassium salexigens DSM 2132]TCP33396.1 phage integrase family protein [Rhodothalassium salexigens DSM 2132]